MKIIIFIKGKSKKSFFDEKPKDGDEEAKCTFGQKFLSEQNWGEQMTETKSTGLLIVDFSTKEIEKGRTASTSFLIFQHFNNFKNF